MASFPGISFSTKNGEWALELSPSEQARWLVDAYRMNVNDEFNKGNLRSIYVQNSTALDSFLDFLTFCVSAKVHGVVIVSEFNWKELTNCAKLCLHQRFSETEAKVKYGDESVRSLQSVASVVWDGSANEMLNALFVRYKAEFGSSINFADLQNWLNEQPSFWFNETNEFSTGSLFQLVGGIQLWSDLYEVLKSTIEHSCANPGCHEVGTKLCGACSLLRYCSGDCQKAHWTCAHKTECLRSCDQLKPFDEVLSFLATQQEVCDELYLSEKFKEAEQASKKLLTFATLQFGEEVCGGTVARKRGNMSVSNAMVDITIAHINTLIGASYVGMQTEREMALSVPYLTKARDSILFWLLQLQISSPMTVEEKILLVKADIALDLAYVVDAINRHKRQAGREFVVDAYELLEVSKDMLPPPVGHELSSVTLGIAQYAVELVRFACQVAEDEARLRTAAYMDDPLGRYTESLARDAMKINIMKYGARHNVTNHSIHIYSDAWLTLPVPKNVKEYFACVVGLIEDALDCSMELNGPDSERTAKIHYTFAHYYQRYSEVLHLEGGLTKAKAKPIRKKMIDSAKTHLLECRRIFLLANDEKHEWVEQCNFLLRHQFGVVC
jgi:hypothetical protein